VEIPLLLVFTNPKDS